MKNIAIIGYGVLGKQILNFIKDVHSINHVAVFDDTVTQQANIDFCLPLNQYLDPVFNSYEFYLGIGYKHLAFRKKVISELKHSGRVVPSLIHPTCYISSSAVIGDACLFFPQCNIDQNVKMEDGNILHNSVVISHDSSLGSCNYISPSATLCGNITVGSENFIGAGTVVAHNVAIGHQSIIGVASCITKDVYSHTSVIGNPQRVLSKKLNLL